MTRYARLTLLLLIALTLGPAACGGGDDEAATTGAATPTAGGGGGGAGGNVQIMTSSGIAYDESSVEASAGEVTIEYTNDSGLQHNVTLEGSGVDGEATDTITEGSADLTVNLEPGEYTFYCSVDTHRDQGMEGTLVVN
jgi:plastocyanin